jgi:peptide/nickel transport system ATP-binding protein
MTALIELKDLAIRTEERMLVEGVNMVVQPGRVTALIGPSGSGKSLTARCSMGVIDVVPGLVRGELRYPELDAEKDWFAGLHGGGREAQAKLLEETRVLRGSYFTYSPQAASSALNPGRTVGRQLQLAIGRRSTPPDDVGAEIGSILNDVGLSSEVASALPGALSGGMAQRAALAIAVAPKPRLVIADEPETGLDPVLRRTVVELLVDVCKVHGAGLLLISHHEDTVARMADDVVRLSGGGE